MSVLKVVLQERLSVPSIGADFAGATGAIAPAVKILRGDAPAVTREVAPAVTR